ncbi:MAG: LamG domain-containing protein [bacterium]|nr:LamG domain-containing protein [bacterium]
MIRSVTKIFILLALLSLQTCVVYAAGIIRPPNNLGLVGYWSFDEGTGTRANDYSGNGNNAVFTGTWGAWTTGKVNNAFDFQQVNNSCSGSSCVSAGSGTSLDNIRQITVMAWIAPDDLGDSSAGNIVNKYGCGADGWRLALDTTSRFAFSYQWTGGVGRWRTTSDVLSFGATFQHVAVTYNSGSSSNNPSLYYNGASVAVSETNTPASSPDNDSANNLHIGISCGTNEFDGRIDEIRVYNRILSAAEIKAIYEARIAKINASKNYFLTNGLLAMWSFDGGGITANQVLDVSVNGNHGGFINGATSTAKTVGKTGQALSFDGADDYIKTSFGPSLTDMTISTWVYLDDSPTGEENIIGAYDNDANGSLMQITLGLGTTVTTPQMYVGDAVGTADYDTVTSSASLATRRWYHIVAVHDADGQNIIYVDGEDTAHPAATTKSDGGMNFSGQPFTIGARNLGSGGGPNTFFDGKIDEVRVYNRALSASEVKSLYQLGVAVNSSQTQLQQGNLKGFWTFNGADITTNQVLDMSGNGNHGGFFGGATSSAKTIGKVGQALQFDGINDYVINSVFSGGTNGGVTISLWAKPAGTTVNQYLIDYGQALGTDSRSIILGFQDGYWNIFKNAYPTGVAADTQIAASGPGIWDNVVYTSNGTTLQGYRNGQLVINVSANLNRTAAPAKTSIGRPIDVDSDYYKGAIDEVRIYNKALTASEVLQLYNMGR